jgi:hypothetical protein
MMEHMKNIPEGEIKGRKQAITILSFCIHHQLPQTLIYDRVEKC